MPNQPQATPDNPLAYADLGYQIFPVVPLKKNPLTPQGFKDATSTQAVIEGWQRQYPDCNWGLRTEGLVIVDIDVGAKGWSGENTQSLFAEYPPLTTTPRGGCHIYFRRPEGCNWHSSAGKIAPHVDIRTGESCIMVPPSKVARGEPPDSWIIGEYKWIIPLRKIDSLPLPPPWLQELLNQETQGWKEIKPFEEAEYPVGARNTSLTGVAGKLRRVGLTPSEIEATLQVLNKARCKPPLSAAEVQGIAKSVSRYPVGPGQAEKGAIENPALFFAWEKALRRQAYHAQRRPR